MRREIRNRIKTLGMENSRLEHEARAIQKDIANYPLPKGTYYDTYREFYGIPMPYLDEIQANTKEMKRLRSILTDAQTDAEAMVLFLGADA